jgi:hypothetical protein
LTIQSISTRQAAPLAAARSNNTGTMKMSTFSIDEHLTQAASSNVAPAASRPLVGASWRGRHIAAAPDRRSATPDPVAPTAASTTPPKLAAVATKNNVTAQSNAAPLVNAQPRPFYVTNSNYNPTDVNSPETIQDPTATAAPQFVEWTSANGLTTTGVMNPFGLTQNNPGMGFYGAPSNNRF